MWWGGLEVIWGQKDPQPLVQVTVCDSSVALDVLMTSYQCPFRVRVDGSGEGGGGEKKNRGRIQGSVVGLLQGCRVVGL